MDFPLELDQRLRRKGWESESKDDGIVVGVCGGLVEVKKRLGNAPGAARSGKKTGPSKIDPPIHRPLSLEQASGDGQDWRCLRWTGGMGHGLHPKSVHGPALLRAC